MTWSEDSHRVIQEALKAHPEAMTDEKVFQKVVLDAYPFGERKYWPYAAWLKAVKEVRTRLFPPESAALSELPLFKPTE